MPAVAGRPEAACCRLDGLGGAGSIAGNGLDRTCVVTVGAERPGVI